MEFERPDPDDLIEEQLAFYRVEAAAYAVWQTEVFERGGGGAKGRAARRERARALEALQRFGPRGQVLELASGTGAFTHELLESADHVTAVDGSPESLAIARAKLASRADWADRVTFVEADLFEWEPPGRFDTVFFGYWLSHVPPARFEAFWEMVARATAPGGRVFFVDSAAASTKDDGDYREWDDLDAKVSLRELHGRRFRVVKVVWEPQALCERLALLGWRAEVERSKRTIWGSARRIGSRSS